MTPDTLRDVVTVVWTVLIVFYVCYVLIECCTVEGPKA